MDICALDISVPVRGDSLRDKMRWEYRTYERIWLFPGGVGRLLEALGYKATAIVIEAPARCGARALSSFRRTDPELRRVRRSRESAGAVRVRVEPQAVVVVRVLVLLVVAPESHNAATPTLPPAIADNTQTAMNGKTVLASTSVDPLLRTRPQFPACAVFVLFATLPPSCTSVLVASCIL